MDIRVEGLQQVAPSAQTAFKERIGTDEFSFELRRIASDGLAERLNGLIGQISEYGNKIAKHTDIRDLKHYRGLIKDFINEVVTNSHEFSRENFLDRRGRHRVYGIVRVINKDLDELAQELLNTEKDHIRILDLTDEIRGLLLDLFI